MTRNIIIGKIVLMLSVVISLTVHGENTDSCGKIISCVGIDVRPSYAFSSYCDDVLSEKLDTSDARKTKLASSIHLKYGFCFSPATRMGRLYPDAWQGLGAAVNFFGNNRGIGTPVSVYAFQGAPVYRFNDKLSIYYEWNFGASFGWKKCNGEVANSNLIVGSNVNAYINIGGGLYWRLNDSYSMTAGLELTHYSNGNTSFPNPGVNLAGIRIGVSKTFGGKDDYKKKSDAFEPDSTGKKNKWQIDVTAYGAWRKRVYRGGESPVLLNGHFAVVGLDVSPMWNVTRKLRAGASLDFQWDESTDLKRHYVSGFSADDICFTRPSIFKQICVGLSGRAELVMPIFSVNVGIGYNFIGPEETLASYQLANLKVRLTQRLFLNIGYQLLNFQKQNNLMLGIGYSFR